MAATAFLAAACGSSSSTTSATTSSITSATAGGTTLVTARPVTGLGTVLVNGEGRTLYIFEPDKHAKVTCVGGCAGVWPPLMLAGKAEPSGGVNAALVARDPDPAGGRVVTYNGWPLYLYTGDSQAGTASGQALNSSGGLWYVITPAGKVVTTKKESSGGSIY